MVLFVNGKFCKNPKLAKADDFFASGLNIPGNTNNRLGISAIVADVNKIPGLNTQGLSLVRLDYAPLGENPPHTHPRATEILALAEGTLYVGFVSSDEDGNRLFAKLLKPGNVYVFPFGLLHFQFNPNRTAPAVAFSALSSQSGGTITIAKSVFGSKPAINPDVLTKAFHLDRKTVELLLLKNA
ncbi:hypothetical protein TIFTF001_042578 [Ficus carica]|uniref:Germin-like protein n=1 Tax=Ficus carica TaxID=3494 RepID=A0AA88A4A1_FICCA|nr:hypothetical protein TIFTF001_042570 [Ficus carica]GMN37067.1 hypothetical protein TIFTF001_042573 [Ficus carica]GMN37087.1 hypothetical protein TIFTF001_042576 [Ficus carica]GMN37102.1 hypothetical protein TIFTF001_042578 [Ficus carica]